MTTNNIRVTLTPEVARAALSALDNIDGITAVSEEGTPVVLSREALGLEPLRDALSSAMYTESRDEVAELREALAKVTAQRDAVENIVKMLSKHAAHVNDVTDELVAAIRDDRDPRESTLREMREITSMGDAINSTWAEYRRSR